MKIVRLSINQAGFTLIEIAIVLLIVTILIGYTVAMFPIQQELKQYRQAEAEMDSIIENLIAFAQVNGRLPCPDSIGSPDSNGLSSVIDGFEDADDGFNSADASIAYVDDINIKTDGLEDGCRGYFGYIPGRTLGLNGDFDNSGRMLDPWGQPYLYHVSDVNTDFNGDGDDDLGDTGIGADLVSPNGVREEGLSNVSPDLIICSDTAALGFQTACPATTDEVVKNVAVVIISKGKSYKQSGPTYSYLEKENLDDLNDGTQDKVYIDIPRSDVAGAEFDDVIKWISPNLLYSKMIEAGQLP